MSQDEAIDVVVMQAWRQLLHLIIAIRTNDIDGATIAATRVKWELAAGGELIGAAADAPRAARRTRFAVVQRAANYWLQLAQRPPFTPEEIERFSARVFASAGELDPEIRARAIELERLELDGLVLSRMGLTSAILVDIGACGAILDDADFTDSMLRRCRFQSSSLTRATLKRCTLAECTFERASLERSTLTELKAARCNFRGVRLTEARLDNAQFDDCDFRGAIFDDTRSGATGFWSAQFRNCVL